MKRHYISPVAGTTSVYVCHQLLEASQIPVGGGSGGFDVKVQNDWEDIWDDEPIEE